MNLARAFADSTALRRDKTALCWGESEWSYAALLAGADALAGELTGRFAVHPGDRVALWLKNRPEFITALLGILGTGAVLVPINNFLKPDEVNYILQDAGIDVLITEQELLAHGPALLAARPQLRVLAVDDPDRTADGSSPFLAMNAAPAVVAAFRPASSRLAATPRAEADLAVIIYTSGTTGRPKGAMLSHGNLLHNIESCRIVLETVHEDRMAVVLPLFHSYMLTVGVLLPLLVGGTIVLVKSLGQPRLIMQELCARRATILPAIPPLYRALASAPSAIPLPFRLCISGSAPLPLQVLQDFEAKFHIPLIEGYGLTEASPVVAKNPIHGLRKPGSIGIPIAHVELTVQDETGQILPPGGIGELCVRGGNVMQGYWNHPDETAAVFRDGWLLTGDVGHCDKDGYFFITDRKKDMLLVNGNNVYPREIEEVIQQYPGVKEAAVIGRPDSRRGEQPVAYVVPNDGVTLNDRELLEFIRRKMADYKVPRQILFLAALPRNATGKILKTTLRELPAV